MNKRNDMRTVRMHTVNGTVYSFPLSRHVLRFQKERPAFALPKSLARQTMTFAVVLALSASSFGITYGSGGVNAYFSDNERSTANVLSAGSLNFDLNPGEVTIPIEQGATVSIAPRFIPAGDFPIEYRVNAKLVGEPSPLCSQLMATGTTTPLFYSGQLTQLVTEPATTTGYGSLAVALPTSEGIANGASCTVDLVYTGWHVGAADNTGYTDEEFDRFTFVFSGPEPVVEGEAAAAAPPLEDSIEPETPVEAPENVTETEPAAVEEESAQSQVNEPISEVPTEPIPDADLPPQAGIPAQPETPEDA